MNVFDGLVDTDRSRHSNAMLRYVLKEFHSGTHDMVAAGGMRRARLENLQLY